MASKLPPPTSPEEAQKILEADVSKYVPEGMIGSLYEGVAKRANVVGNATTLGLVQGAWEELDAAEKEGMSHEEGLARVAQTLKDRYVGNATKAASRLDIIAKQFSIDAMAIARQAGIDEGDVDVKGYGYLRFDAVLDDKTTEVCADLDGTVLAADDPFWAAHTPPLHINCRSQIVPVTNEEAAKMGIGEPTTASKPAEGFGAPGELWEPEPDDYYDQIYEIYKAKFGEDPDLAP